MPIPCGRRGWVPEHLPLCPSGRYAIETAEGDKQLPDLLVR